MLLSCGQFLVSGGLRLQQYFKAAEEDGDQTRALTLMLGLLFLLIEFVMSALHYESLIV